MECWGAEGGNDLGNGPGGKGGYTAGWLNIVKNTSLYIYIGQMGASRSDEKSGAVSTSSINHGGLSTGAAGGGASTDIRLTNGNWDNFNSLKSRIMVAGGGGGGENSGHYGGAGGGINGGNGFNGQGATSKAGYAFGTANYTTYLANTIWGGSGNGYFSGYPGTVSAVCGGGGSAFISGYSGCYAINESSTSSNITFKSNANHYSGYIFTNMSMVSGDSNMPSPTGGTETGHSGNGYCKITWHPSL